MSSPSIETRRCCCYSDSIVMSGQNEMDPPRSATNPNAGVVPNVAKQDHQCMIAQKQEPFQFLSLS